MDKHFKTLFILNLISTVIILTLGVLLSIGTLSVTEVMQEKINAKEKTIEELKARCEVRTSTHLYTEAATTTTAQKPGISSTTNTEALTPEISSTITTEVQKPEISSAVTTTTAQKPEISSTATTQETLKYRFEAVAQGMKWEAARKYCQDRNGDLIQKDPRLLTKSGRIEISQQLQLLLGNIYHTGIRRSETNKNVFIRSADGVEVALSGWYTGYPSSNDGWDVLLWRYGTESNKNTILNDSDRSWFFICEY